MASPEIHILAPRDGSKGKRQKKERAASGHGKPSKRQRVGVRRGNEDKDGEEAEVQRPVVKRELLSTNTQSFRHLFSFALDQGDGADSANAVSENGNKRESGGGAEPSKPRDVEPEVRFSIFDEEEVVVKTAAEASPALAGLDASDKHDVEVQNLPFAKAAKEEFVVHDGLAHDSLADVRAMALEFNGSGLNIAELQTEWLDGGKKEDLREDLRLKRYKRMRGRSLSKDGLRRNRVNERRGAF